MRRARPLLRRQRDLDQVEQNLRRIRQSLSRMQQGMLSGTKSGDGSFQFSRVPVTDGTAEAHSELCFG